MKQVQHFAASDAEILHELFAIRTEGLKYGQKAENAGYLETV